MAKSITDALKREKGIKPEEVVLDRGEQPVENKGDLGFRNKQ